MPTLVANNEGILLDLVTRGVLEIDAEGCVWRNGQLKYGVFTPGPRVRAEFPSTDGYLMLRRHHEGRQVMVQAHRVVWIYFHGPIPAGCEINHKNTIKTVNRPDNLEPITHAANMEHAYANELIPTLIGSAHGMAKLTEADVGVIRRELVAATSTLIGLANRYCLTKKMVENVARGEFWKHVTDPPPLSFARIRNQGVWVTGTPRCVATVNASGFELGGGCRPCPLIAKGNPHAVSRVRGVCLKRAFACEHHIPVWVGDAAELTRKLGKVILGWEL